MIICPSIYSGIIWYFDYQSMHTVVCWS